VGLLAALVFVISALPAAVVVHFLPPYVQAKDLSGSLWHGSAGHLSVNGRDAGTLEWRLHPASLFTLAADTELHWVKVSFVIDGTATFRLHTVHATLRGGGPIEDLTDLGMLPGWRGVADVAVRDIASDYSRLSTLAGDVTVSDLVSAQLGGGAPLGNYLLNFADDAVGADGSVTGALRDLGGPLKIQGTLKLSQTELGGAISATVKENADVAPALRSELDSLAQMRGRSRDGSIPVDLEFTF
jgi:hypothetical protein